ncbi:MAG: restriction endonuclease subunit S [Pseudomonadota bacterium]|nr:restriction endonuclease subunit S [Pseudomonadota bacterium]
MSSYPSYSHSDVSWIGQIPSHWHQCSLKHVIENFIAGGTPSTSEASFWSESDDGTPWVAIGDMSGRDSVFAASKRLTATGMAEKRLSAMPAGTVIYSMYASVGFAAMLHVPAVTNQAILGLVHDENVNPIFLRGFLNALRPHVLREVSSNTQDNLNAEKVKNLPFVLPPLAEQIAIAGYLDAETARIDMLIEGKEQLQALLQELKHSTLTKAIHEGLEPDAPMNDSGVSWFSKLPSHWAPMRLKRVIDGIENGWSPQCEGEPAAPGQWGVLKAGACNGGVFRMEENKALPSNEDPRPELEIKPGNVLMSRASGSLDLVGSVAFVEDVPTGLMLSDKIFRLKIDDEEVCGEWLALALNSSPMRRQIASFVGGAEGLARNIASGNIRELVLPLPPRKEQVQIVQAVKRDLARIAELVMHVAQELELLRELRTSTITDAVLGRIDVRKTKNN